MNDIRISLNAEDFKKLINWEIVFKQSVQIALQDIWFELMQYELNKAKEKFSTKIKY